MNGGPARGGAAGRRAARGILRQRAAGFAGGVALGTRCAGGRSLILILGIIQYAVAKLDGGITTQSLSERGSRAGRDGKRIAHKSDMGLAGIRCQDNRDFSPVLGRDACRARWERDVGLPGIPGRDGRGAALGRWNRSENFFSGHNFSFYKKPGSMTATGSMISTHNQD